MNAGHTHGADPKGLSGGPYGWSPRSWARRARSLFGGVAWPHVSHSLRSRRSLLSSALTSSFPRRKAPAERIGRNEVRCCLQTR